MTTTKTNIIVDKLMIDIKKHTENWKNQCGYITPYDYYDLRIRIERILRKHKS